MGTQSGKGWPTVAAEILRHLGRGGRAWVIFLGPERSPFVGDLDGGVWPWLVDAMTDDEVVECHAGGGGRGGGGLQGETLSPLLLASRRPAVEGWLSAAAVRGRVRCLRTTRAAWCLRWQPWPAWDGRRRGGPT
jgi:hypothetical protein